VPSSGKCKFFVDDCYVTIVKPESLTITCRVIGSIIVSASQNIPMLIVGRVINGFSVGIESAQVPVYISEIAPPSKRGRLVGAQQWAITWGIMIMFYASVPLFVPKRSRASVRRPSRASTVDGLQGNPSLEVTGPCSSLFVDFF